MNWLLPVPIPEYPYKVSHRDKVFSIGSCFAQHIADRFVYYKFACTSNPYGTLFHPIPLLQNLTNALNHKELDSDLFLERDEVVFHYSCHSSFWAETKGDLKKKLEEVQLSVANNLKESKLLILTFGSAFLYQLASGKAVANCHKQPNNIFLKERSSVEDIFDVFKSFYTELKIQNPKIKILLTVSPVRHIRDGVHENNVSKSVLLLACDSIQKNFKDVHYFPAFEIIMDELRDYRFYEKDRVHPNDEARLYVWGCFVKAFLSKDSIKLNKELDSLFSSLNHKVFRDTSLAHNYFLEKTLEQALGLNEKVDLQFEINELKHRLQ